MRAHPYVSRIKEVVTTPPFGLVTAVNGSSIEASGPIGAIGEICTIEDRSAGEATLAEIVASRDDGISLMMLESGIKPQPGLRVTTSRFGSKLPAGDAFAGRAIDALARPLDGKSDIRSETVPKRTKSILERRAPDQRLTTGIKAIDGLLTLGVGQRIGIFAASGVGKTSLVEQMVRQVGADRIVICLVGERGREVSGFWDAISHDRTRYTLVASTSDESPVMRIRAVEQALALADHWRQNDEHVLLVIDSITRYAMALREVGLAAGAPPTVRAYTPNVFAALPAVVEQCGAIESSGAITAVMTVLSETDEVDDPVVEIMKSLLDGHIILSRRLAEKRHFPAIDIVRSVSRQAERLMDGRHSVNAREAIGHLATYEESRVMIESGLYRSGSNLAIDRCLSVREDLNRFLIQTSAENCSIDETLAQLSLALQPGGANG